MLNDGEADALALEPSFFLLEQVLIPEIHKALKLFQLPYTFKVSSHTFFITIRGNTCRLICASAENWEKLIGLNLCAIYWDEVDVLKQENAQMAFVKLLGRIRVGNHRQFFFSSTPEGYKFLYKTFVTDAEKNHSRLIQASSLDNHFLPTDFFEALYASYSPAQLNAYISGTFVNLAQASVFDFDRSKNHADIIPDDTDVDRYIACDFNAGSNVTIFALYQDEEIFIYDEYVAKDTFETRDVLKQRLPENDIWCAADASGGRTTTLSDHEVLREVPGLVVVQGQANPNIMASVLSANTGFRNKKIWVDTNRCPGLTNALEQHAYDKYGKPEKSNIHIGGSIDDFTDCARYLVWYLMPLNKPSWHQYNQN